MLPQGNQRQEQQAKADIGVCRQGKLVHDLSDRCVNAFYSRSLKHTGAALTHAAGMSGTKAQRDLH